MNTKIDLKSAVFGLILGILAMLALGSTTGEPVGRYQVAGGAGFFTIVDTTTGKAWGANFAAPAPGFQGVQAGYWDKKLDH